jgi:hypothetical protein
MSDKKVIAVKTYSIKFLDTYNQAIFQSKLGVFDEWFDEIAGHPVDMECAFWFSENEFKGLENGHFLYDENYLIELDKDNYKTVEIAFYEEKKQ